MNCRLLIILVLLFLLPMLACEKTHETPPELESAYHDLLLNLNPNKPGTSINRLEDFRKSCGAYPLAQTVAAKVAQMRAGLEEHADKARKLAALGKVRQAEAIVDDIDRCLSAVDTDALRAEIYLIAARSYLVKKDFAKAAEALESVNKSHLDEKQRREWKTISSKLHSRLHLPTGAENLALVRQRP